MSVLARYYRNATQEHVLLAAFFLAIFYGNIYARVTLPLAMYILPMLALRLKIRTIKWQAVVPALACLPVVFQFFGPYPPIKNDISVYFCFFYSAVSILVLSRCHADESLVQNCILFGSVLTAFIMLANAAFGYREHLDFYTLKNLIATPLGSSNYLAVFLLVGTVVALYARQYLCAVALVGAFMLTFSRTGYAMLILAVAIWLLDTRTALLARYPKLFAFAFISGGLAVFLAAFFMKSGLPESLSIRVGLWHAALYHIADNPLIGAPRSEYFYIFNGLAWDPHNSILNMLLLLGVGGTAIYLFYLYCVMSLFSQMARGSRFWRSVFMASAVTLLWSCFEVILLTPAFDTLLASLFALAIARSSRLGAAPSPAALEVEAPSVGQVVPR
ncbi:hypothetical protein PPUJ20028_26880 [Pseudomonas putida]|uniref:O-antigen ligase family protein n=1 Tax=Pseudomonas putida TaxID=303 RepID=A0AA37RGT0_PSEPU|nr:O-antigen ligase family protein [Pseudomonas putida]GLO14106.1 hypothetical protein PPUJ20028_26880 [Pseudomonas putida]GLO33884.1 hypothetical protein PPUN14671_07170 [Pseudomonas putida]HDS0965901.1 O-antigen ligase family protein [Pseudomonas putida]HDS0991157.1 O-antigen ligase family protein [Pseudomonas putida]